MEVVNDNEVLYEEANSYFDNTEYEEAFRVFISLAKEDYVPAQDMVGYMYLEGIGVEKNYIQSINWWNKSVKKNSVYAQFQLGCLFIRENDINKGLKLLEIANNNYSSEAMYLLGGYYYHGTHVDEDKDRAISLYKKATLLGNEDAAKDLMRALNIKYGKFKTFFIGINISLSVIYSKIKTLVSLGVR